VVLTEISSNEILLSTVTADKPDTLLLSFQSLADMEVSDVDKFKGAVSLTDGSRLITSDVFLRFAVGEFMDIVGLSNLGLLGKLV